MKIVIKVVAPILLLLTAAATIALAAPITPTDPYPNVPANPDVCQVEKLEIQKAQNEYNTAKDDYARVLELWRRGSAAIGDVRAADRAVQLAGIKLNNAKYAEAKCRNEKGNDPKKVCIDLSLELNRLTDELAMRKVLEQLASDDYAAGLELARKGAISPSDLAKLKLAYDNAVLDRKQVEQKIKDQKAAIAANPACTDYPSERPTPTSTTPTSPTSTTPSTTAPTPTTSTSTIAQ